MPFKSQMGMLSQNPMMMNRQAQAMNEPGMAKPPAMRPPMPKKGGLGSMQRLQALGQMR